MEDFSTMTSPQSDQNLPVFYSLKGAAAALGIGYQPCWRRLRRGDFEGVKRAENGEWLIPLPSIAKVKAGMKRHASEKEVVHHD